MRTFAQRREGNTENLSNRPETGPAQDEEDLPDLRKEVRYIQEKAVKRDSRVVSIGDLMLFSTSGGDGWMLDTEDALALRLASDSEPLDVLLETRAAGYKIGWTGRYRIDGAVFIYVDEVTEDFEPFLGYPVQQIARRTKRTISAVTAAERDAQDLLQTLRKQTGRD